MIAATTEVVDVQKFGEIYCTAYSNFTNIQFLKIILVHMSNSQFRKYHQYDLTLSGIIEKLEEGRSVTSVAEKFGIVHSIVSRA